MQVYRPGLCQLLVFLSSAFACWSVWLTVSYTAERLVAVRRPLWRLQLGSAKLLRPRYVVLATALFSFCFNAPLVFFVRVHSGPDEVAECSLAPEYENALYYMNILDTVLTLIVPFFLITTMNAMIGRSVYLFYARYRRQRMGCDGSRPLGETSGPPASRKSAEGNTENHTAPTAISGGGMAHSTQIGVTRMLLVVSTAFVLLNFPSYVMRIYVFALSIGGVDGSTGSLPYVLQRYFMLLYYTNFAINFVLYNASSHMFRVALREYLSSRLKTLRASVTRCFRASAERPSSCRRTIDGAI
ncbi:hypothetical protein V5799_027350 [Amblyomma americanum]|uniref:G-protein coupled receptors family 1 profile domain-containing protein n=1 Tax=Amblyomma americanum TaxID=6943 RepID=A0AAQ4DFZ3_AMBAM